MNIMCWGWVLVMERCNRFGCWFWVDDEGDRVLATVRKGWVWLLVRFIWFLVWSMAMGIQNILVSHGYRCSKISDEDEYLKCSFCFSFVVVSCALSLLYGHFDLLLWVLESFICILVCFRSSWRWRWIFKTLSFLLFINKISHWLEGCCVQFIIDNGSFSVLLVKVGFFFFGLSWLNWLREKNTNSISISKKKNRFIL